jgi:hypothetical protein
MPISRVSNNVLQHEEVVALILTLCIHVLDGDIGCIIFTMAIREFNIVSYCVRERGGACLPSCHAVKASLPSSDLPSLNLITNSKLHACTHILVIFVNIMFIQILNVRHLECRFLLFLVSVMSRRHKVCKVRVNIELMVLHTITKFHLD